MTASYPGSIKTFTPKVDNVDDVMAIDVNELQEEIAAIETEMGTNSEFLRTAFDGTMLNGKISVTAASNDLTVSLLSATGGTPSASNPVRIKINGTWRAIVAALSVTKNAGTNWCNAGSAAMATKEIDYFAYIGYNATDGVVIGFSRISYATLYGDFSTTTTNEKYAAISTIANAAAGDNYVVIGRFAATLSAGAGYTWSVPTYTTANLIQRPIYSTRSLSWTGAVTSGGGAPVNPTSITGTYIFDGTKMFLSVVVPVVDKGTATGSMFIAGPFTPLAAMAISGSENVSTGSGCTSNYQTTPRISAARYDGTTLWVNTYNFVSSGWVLIG